MTLGAHHPVGSFTITEATVRHLDVAREFHLVHQPTGRRFTVWITKSGPGRIATGGEFICSCGATSCVHKEVTAEHIGQTFDPGPLGGAAAA